ncbi:hypothetical protein [Pseudomonas sp. PDM20]|uniref:hypothetical protein n=1 Tax=Pseudomonas sp. PDM20 TaxID=2769254 RepID=UPI00178199B6|nr:hypothetical protein [Pseudomonas sp. PDM20]MBD9683829.1 hypothetical protein [Pseudomonas sp. PDM20]MBD9683841.1 hypothetical protein [Pseudomonas sp. PDM20]
MITPVTGKPGEGMTFSDRKRVLRLILCVADAWWFPFLLGVGVGVGLIAYGEDQMLQIMTSGLEKVLQDLLHSCGVPQ